MKRFISTQKDFILSCLDKHERILLQANAGSGKTTLVNEIALEQEILIIAPYNSVIGVYNDVAILSHSLQYVGSKPTVDEIPATGSVVMNFDNAVRHWGALKKRYSTIVLDESHTLFTDRAYRDVAIKLMKLLKDDYTGRLMCITATPLKEAEILHCEVINEQKYEQMKDLNKLNIRYQFIGTTQVEAMIYELLKINSDYDHIMLFDNQTAVEMYHNAIVDFAMNDATLFHSTTQSFDDNVQKCYETEMLQTKYAFGTNLVLAGMNFNNTGRVLTIQVMRKGESLYNDFIQAPARFRKADVTAIVVVDKTDRCADKCKVSKTEIRRLAYEMQRDAIDACNLDDVIFVKSGVCDAKILDEDYLSALREIEQYRKKNSEISVIYNAVKRIYKTTSIGVFNDRLSFKKERKKTAVSQLFFANYLNDRGADELMKLMCTPIEKVWCEVWLRRIDHLENKYGAENLKRFIREQVNGKTTFTSLIELLDKMLYFKQLSEHDVEIAKETSDKTIAKMMHMYNFGDEKSKQHVFKVLQNKQRKLLKVMQHAVVYLRGIDDLKNTTVSIPKIKF